jgi:hypothetical protein
MMTRNECATWLAEHDNFCILTHTRPDGDTIGSASSLCLGLRQLGKTAYLLENGEAYREQIHTMKEAYFYNLGSSGEAGARYIIKRLTRKKKKAAPKAENAAPEQTETSAV